ncbi:aminoglycoside phosphotransferase [Ameyamaea chiangmaiensis NBRC 103196]|uniref:Phosphotransferase n=1 Tax=Ameyamaea chiangmaiensis TaxID=442969 RepID=A0A850PE87_9PROT|nr:phosphotransferase [Ameyamaea chiangmaiensis]MBS4075567.1 phosphotransferase [Ameyamaea chiangmaiensis]NVN40252.1 phosphotransferase [Ameyamaea chiangmaiensis]GBQ69298.1 aminoglycoside phosphotransferase [Ameyamaea chiangmaiensis NBRC 103196]
MTETTHYAHGLGKTLKRPDWPELTAEDASAVLARFPRAGNFQKIAWRSPRPFSAAARIDTDRGGVFIKRHHHRLRSVSDLGEEHRLMAYLRAQGQPVVPVLCTDLGHGVLSDGVWCYEVHGLGDGVDVYQDRSSWTPFLTSGHARAAGGALAGLHRIMRAYDAPPRRSPLLINSDGLMRAPTPIATLEARLVHRPALAYFLAERPWRQDLVDHVLRPWHDDARAAMDAVPASWGHGDWHGSNLLWSSGEANASVATILDFGLADRTSALFDLATAIERGVIPWLDLEDGEPVAALDHLDAFLAGYGSVLPVTSSLLDALAAVLPVVHVDFALSEIDYFVDLLGDDEQADVAYGPYLLGHADWFGRPEGQRLLRHLRTLASRGVPFR